MTPSQRISSSNPLLKFCSAVFESPRLPRASLLAALALWSHGELPAVEPALETAFDAPSLTARPLGWWHWINGNVSKEGIAADLEDMKKSGMGGVQLFDVEIYLPPGPIRYGSDQWHEHLQYAVKKCAELGLEFHTMNTPGWSASGGPWVTAEKSMKRLVFTETPAKGGEVDMAIPKPELRPFYSARTTEKNNSFYRDIRVLAVPATSERLPDLEEKINFKTKPVVRTAGEQVPGIPRDRVLDLTQKMDADGQLKVSLPPGDWVILRFGYTTTGKTNHPAVPEGHGLEIDKFDADAVAFQFEESMGRMIRESGPLAGSTFSAILFDSFEGGFQNWTERFPEMFQESRGYDLLPYLPVLTGRVVESEAVSEAVLWDFRKVIEDLMAEKYFGTMHRLASKHGIKLYSESQGGPLNPAASNRFIDVPMNEFWMPDSSSRASRIKQSVSSGHFLGRQLAAAEAFTATPENARYLATPATLKIPGDQAFTYGINRFCFHSHTHQPFTEAMPGFSLGRYGTHFGRLNTWWPYAGPWISYLARCQGLLQQGRTVADICLLLDEDLGYSLPTKIVSTFPGYNFATCYPPDLLRMVVKDGQIVHPDAGSFRVLVTPQKSTAKSWVAEIPTLKALRDLVMDGAVLIGPPPTAPAGLKDLEQKAEFDRLVAEVWGGDSKSGTPRPLGKGQVFPANAKPTDVLAGLGIARDLAWNPAEANVQFIHRQAGGEDFYFVLNDSDEACRLALTFRQTGRKPEIWDPVTGKRAPAPIYVAGAQSITVPMDFEPHGSAFFVFRNPLPAEWVAAASPVDLSLKTGPVLAGATRLKIQDNQGQLRELDLPALPEPKEIQGPWDVEFLKTRDGDLNEQMASLASWSSSDRPAIRFHSGSAVYRTTFPAEVPNKNQTVLLDLGGVADIAQVTLNGQSVGILWHPPFRADITPYLKSGENKLEIRVANRWINRLIGDADLERDFTYQPEGKNKFTDGRLQKLPAWFYDAPTRKEKLALQSFTVWQQYKSTDPLVDSGLLGPVQLKWFNQVNLFGN